MAQFNFVWEMTEYNYKQLQKAAKHESTIPAEYWQSGYFGRFRCGDLCFEVYQTGNCVYLGFYVGGVDDGYGYSSIDEGYPYTLADYCGNLDWHLPFDEFKAAAEKVAAEAIAEYGYIDKANEPLHIW